MKKEILLLTILILGCSTSHASFIVCENNSFKVDVLTEHSIFIEDDGMEGASFDGKLVLTDKRTTTSFEYDNVLQTHNEFNDYGVYAMAFSKELDLYQAVSFEYASEGDITAIVSIHIPAKGLGDYNGFSDYEEPMYETSQEMNCKIKG
jgi:hypothetical protein